MDMNNLCWNPDHTTVEGRAEIEREFANCFNPFAYTVKYCFHNTVIAVTGLTYDEAWQARKLHSLSGKTAWVEEESVPTYAQPKTQEASIDPGEILGEVLEALDSGLIKPINPSALDSFLRPFRAWRKRGNSS